VAFAAQAQRRFRNTSLFLAFITKYSFLKAIGRGNSWKFGFLAIFRFYSGRQIPGKSEWRDAAGNDTKSIFAIPI
jgi:hypothetical protein